MVSTNRPHTYKGFLYVTNKPLKSLTQVKILTKHMVVCSRPEQLCEFQIIIMIFHSSITVDRLYQKQASHYHIMAI